MQGTAIVCIEMHINVIDKLEQGQIVSLAFTDARAGFDTVPHTYLLRKLQLIGYPENTLELVDSNLSDRATTVKIEGSESRTEGGPGSPNFWREYFLAVDTDDLHVRGMGRR
jgi:hypothetical protein